MQIEKLVILTQWIDFRRDKIIPDNLISGLHWLPSISDVMIEMKFEKDCICGAPDTSFLTENYSL